MKKTNEGSDERDELNDLLDKALMKLVGENKIELARRASKHQTVTLCMIVKDEAEVITRAFNMAYDESIQDFIFLMTPEQKKATY